MNKCIECGLLKDGECQSPKQAELITQLTGMIRAAPNWSLPFIRLILCKGYWFEPKTTCPGEGFRLLVPGEDLKEEGDEYLSDDTNTWELSGNRNGSPITIGGNVLAYRRRMIPTIVNCPCGHTAELFGHNGGYFVGCSGLDCTYRGGLRPSKVEAVLDWNKRMSI